MGDHGMADGGGHGGSTTPEVLVPFLVISGSLTTQSEVSIPEVTVTVLVISGVLTTQSEVSIAVSNRPVFSRHFQFTDNAE